MIELHTHILSYVDDGAATFDLTLEMLREEVRQGGIPSVLRRICVR